MRHGELIRRSCALVLTAALGAACSSDSTGEPDASVDTDVAVDGGGDADTGADADAGTEPDADTGTEPDADTGTEPDADGGADVDASADADAGADADTGVEPDADTGVAVEICDDGEDNDGDGDIDCADADCADTEACLVPPNYVNGELRPCTWDGPDATATYDRWEVVVTSGIARLTVDTPFAVAAFEPAFEISTTPDRMGSLVVAYGEVDCTEGPGTYRCAQAFAEPGTYSVFVYSRGNCTDPAVGQYTLAYDGDVEPPTLLVDDGILLAHEICDDGIDNDLYLGTDCDDLACIGDPACGTPETVTGDIVCGLPGGLSVDVWEVNASTDSFVRVDTIAELTAFNVAAVIVPTDVIAIPVGFPEGLPGADDVIPCSFSPPSGACPVFTVPAGRSWIAVYSQGSCADDVVGEYALSIADAVVAPVFLTNIVVYDEICNDRTDNDVDGAVDCDDTDCVEDIVCTSLEVCDDHVDNDGNGWVDCADLGCAGDLTCDPTPGALVPCADGVFPNFDSYRVEVPAGGTTIRVDTVADATAFDAVLGVFTLPGVWDDFDDIYTLLAGDDEVACTFPPPSFACPEATFDEGTYEILVWSASLDNCVDPTMGEYELVFSASDVVATLVLDDVRFPFVETLCGDGVDNDFDGNTDCDDPDCRGVGACGDNGDGRLTPCGPVEAEAEYETWIVDVLSGTAVVRVDTSAAVTTFDPGLRELLAPSDVRGAFHIGDDERPCTFPPAEFACPSATLGVGRHEVMVISYGSCAVDELAEFTFIVEGDVDMVQGQSGVGAEWLE